jgi:hypothetical protein
VVQLCPHPFPLQTSISVDPLRIKAGNHDQNVSLGVTFWDILPFGKYISALTLAPGHDVWKVDTGATFAANTDVIEAKSMHHTMDPARKRLLIIL